MDTTSLALLLFIELVEAFLGYITKPGHPVHPALVGPAHEDCPQYPPDGEENNDNRGRS